VLGHSLSGFSVSVWIGCAWSLPLTSVYDIHTIAV
jgi:hypothetical protein